MFVALFSQGWTKKQCSFKIIIIVIKKKNIVQNIQYMVYFIRVYGMLFKNLLKEVLIPKCIIAPFRTCNRWTRCFRRNWPFCKFRNRRIFEPFKWRCKDDVASNFAILLSPSHLCDSFPFPYLDWNLVYSWNPLLYSGSHCK